MTGDHVTEHVVEGLRAFTLANEQIGLTVLPELGAKVLSLHDRRNGREWLAQPIRPLRRAELGADWAAYDCAGWDECFPNISAGHYPAGAQAGRPLPDHGELWSRPWSVTSDGESLTTTVDGAAYAYRFRRTLRLEGERVLVDYEVANTGAEPFRGMWSMHPLLVAVPGAELLLTGVTCVRVDWSNAPRWGRVGERHAWPVADRGGGRSLQEVLPAEEQVALKLYAGDLTAGNAALRAADGWLAMRFDPRQIPFLGLWLNYGGWPAEGGLHQVALEPCTGSTDDLAVAFEDEQPASIATGESRRWRVEFELGGPD